jgi:hypothetical protein
MVEGLLSKYKILISYPCAEKKKEGWKGGRKERREGGREARCRWLSPVILAIRRILV